MPVIIPGTDCVLANPIEVSTQGVLDDTLGVATLGWITVAPDQDPIVDIPSNNVGALVGDPRREWWVRRDESEPWFGPLSYRDANSQARRMTMDVDETISEIKYAQVGTILGSRGGDPNVDPNMFVAYLYANGKQYLGGRMAEFNKDKVPVT